jgi:hypothetical protein
MLETLVVGTQKSKERRDEIIETSLAVIHQLSMQPDPTIHPYSIEYHKACALEYIGQFLLEREDLTEDKAKKGLQYLDESRK